MNAVAALAAAWVDVGPLSAVPQLGARSVEVGGYEVAVFRTADDRVYALENRCPHKAGPLAQGIVHDARVTCPLHNWIIDLDLGQALAPDQGCVRRFAVRLEGDRILLSSAPV